MLQPCALQPVSSSAISPCTFTTGCSSLCSYPLRLQDMLQQMQHHTLTVEECTGSHCTKEVVNVHDTATLAAHQHQQQQQQSQLDSGLQAASKLPVNASENRLGAVSIQKQVGKPLVVTVKQDDADPGQQVESGGALLTDEAKDRVASLNQASSDRLAAADPQVAQRAAEVAEELGRHSAATRVEGDNVLEIHRDDIDPSSGAFDAAALSNRANVSDENSLQILQDSNSSSLLSGFNSERARAQTQQQAQDSDGLDIRLGTSKQH